MRPSFVAAAGFLIPACASPGWADENEVTLNDQTGVAVAIYNQDLALVRDSRLVTLTKGGNDIVFIDVSGQIQPGTALLKSPNGKLDVLEQNFDFDLLTPEKLLEKSIGGTVRVVSNVPVTGKEKVEDAKVLSVANSGPVTVILAQTVPGDWKMIRESMAHEKFDASTALWHVSIPAGGSSKLTYRVRVRY